VGSNNLTNNFPNVIDAKIKEGIFIGPQISQLMQDKQFDEDLNETEKLDGCLLRLFARTYYEIKKERTIRMMCKTC
jgi:hypothetical protein